MFQRSLVVAATVLAACCLPAASGQANEPWYPCGGIFWGSGAISSPGYPNNYPNNANCTWILNANTTGYGIRLQFTTLETEPNYDFVRISDGKRQLSYNGTGLSIPALMLDRRVVVTFISDSSNTHSGFRAMFTTVSNGSCGGNVTGSGYIESEYYPLNYPDSKACTWYLQASSYLSVIKLQFTSFSTEPSYDVVKIYDERNYTYSYSGDALPPILILGRLARVEFWTDSSISKQGFRATMTSVNTGNYSACTAIGNYWCQLSNQCISRKWLCDRQPDCLYGEDEASCTITTPSPQSQCIAQGRFWCGTSVKCISQSWRCDGASDCAYGEDERGCITTTSAPPSQSQCIAQGRFWCGTSVKCISQSWRCDGTSDCTYGEDERGCSTTLSPQSQCTAASRFWCRTSNKCISQSWTCDGTNDCYYGEDESGCSASSSMVGAIVGGVIGSIVGITVIVIVIVFACRAVSTRNANATVGARVMQYQNATAAPGAVWSVQAGRPAQYTGTHTPQVQFGAPPSYDASTKAYYAGWQVSDQLPNSAGPATSSGPATNAQAPAQAQGAPA